MSCFVCICNSTLYTAMPTVGESQVLHHFTSSSATRMPKDKTRQSVS